MAILDDLQAQVQANTTVIESALSLIQGLKDALDAAGTNAAKLKEIKDALAAEDSKLAAAVAANTGINAAQAGGAPAAPAPADPAAPAAPNT